jgi:AcrR family transcriptional regulator
MSVTQDESAPRRRMSAADRREVILDAALDEFALNGFHETSLEGVAERAGISKALIYEHFSSKRDLHGALLGRYVHGLLEGVIGAIGTADPPEERLRGGADAFLAWVEGNREPWRLMVRSPADGAIVASGGHVQREIAHAIASLMQADITEEVEEGFSDVQFEVEMAAQQIVGSLRGLADWWDAHRDVPRERLLAAHMDVVWMGLERLSKGEAWPGRSGA